MKDTVLDSLDHFPTNTEEIEARLSSVDPLSYCKNRNYLDGSVTRLSPYISRGYLTTRRVLASVLDAGYSIAAIERFVQELAWRDYWQQVWFYNGEKINSDFRTKQTGVSNTQIPQAVVDGKTGIEAIDKAIAEFYQTGYLHNHMRMYIASIACNIGQSHWFRPSKWMYYHLLDCDWASNALSWQWVAGTNSNKKYYCNQENINRYCYSMQHGTFLDHSYEVLPQLEVPKILEKTTALHLNTTLPNTPQPDLNSNLPTLIYNFYNLDPEWHFSKPANRILLLEPSHFQEYPVSQKVLNFALNLSKNIPSLQIYVSEFSAFHSLLDNSEVYYKEHPLNTHYKGIEEPRDWMFQLSGNFSSFFKFWKMCKKEL